MKKKKDQSADAPKANEFVILIRTDNCKPLVGGVGQVNITINVVEQMTIYELRQLLTVEYGDDPFKEGAYIFQGNMLHFDKTLKDYGIGDQDQIHVNYIKKYCSCMRVEK